MKPAFPVITIIHIHWAQDAHSAGGKLSPRIGSDQGYEGEHRGLRDCGFAPSS